MILIFLIAIGGDYSYEMKNSEIWAPAFFKHNNSFIATVIVKCFECQDGHVHLRGSLSRYVNQYLLFNCLCFFFYSLHLGIQSGPCEEELIRLDEAYVQNKYKVSIINTIALSKNTAD